MAGQRDEVGAAAGRQRQFRQHIAPISLSRRCTPRRRSSPVRTGGRRQAGSANWGNEGHGAILADSVHGLNPVGERVAPRSAGYPDHVIVPGGVRPRNRLSGGYDGAGAGRGEEAAGPGQARRLRSGRLPKRCPACRVEDRERIALRRGDGDGSGVAVCGDRADIVAKARQHVLRHVEELQLACRAPPCRRAPAARWPDPHTGSRTRRSPVASMSMCRIDSWCSDGGSSCFSIRSPGQAVDQHEGRLHGRKVELGAAEIRMRLDAAIGDGERSPVAEQQQLVRPDAMGREFADARESRRWRRRCRPCRRRCRNRSRSRRAARRRAKTRHGRRNAGRRRSGWSAVRRCRHGSKTTAKVPGWRAKTTERPRWRDRRRCRGRAPAGRRACRTLPASDRIAAP